MKGQSLVCYLSVILYIYAKPAHKKLSLLSLLSLKTTLSLRFLLRLF